MRVKQILPKDLLKALVKLGFAIKRRKGSHVFIERLVNSKTFVTSISIHNEPLPRGTFKAILKQADIEEEELKDLL